MTEKAYHLAQMSVSLAKAPLDDPMMEGFVSQLKYINSVADEAPGFVWRLQTEEGDATGIRGYDDPLKLLNMSLWESVETLKEYVYRSDHAGPYRNARQWFNKLDGPTTVLWWVAKGHIPSVTEGVERLDYLAKMGPSPEAFTFRHAFPPPDAEVSTTKMESGYAGSIR